MDGGQKLALMKMGDGLVDIQLRETSQSKHRMILRI